MKALDEVIPMDEAAFAAAAERHRRELHVHCYRMLGSFHDAEDAVQETMLRAWRYRGSLRLDAPLRPWLYRIATNVCFDGIARERRAPVADDVESQAASSQQRPAGEVTWLQPYPDALLEPVAPRDAEPDAQVVTKETIELAFLTVIQLLTPQQRAALILRDVLGWSAKEAAELLETSVAAVNGALQRARATLKERLPARRPEWPRGVDAAAAERELVRRYIEASEKADVSVFTALIREDAVFRMPPDPGEWVGRDNIIDSWVQGGFGTESFGRFRGVVTRANTQPALAFYVRKPGSDEYLGLAMDVLRIEEGRIAEIITFGADIFEAFGLPASLPAGEA